MNVKNKKILYIVFGLISILAGLVNYFTSETVYEKSTTIGFVLTGIVMIYLSKFHKR